MRKHPTNPRNMGVPRSYLELGKMKEVIIVYSDFKGGYFSNLNYNGEIVQCDKMYRKTPGPKLAAKVVLAILLMYKQ